MGSTLFKCQKLQKDCYQRPNIDMQVLSPIMHYKHCIVYNYIKREYKTLIPTDIYNLIVIYFSLQSVIEFDKRCYGKYLKFINNTKIIKDDPLNDEWNFYIHGCCTCLIDAVVTDKICNKFSIDFKLSKTDKWKSEFRLGYTTSIGQIKHWNHGLGEGQNKNDTFGVSVN